VGIGDLPTAGGRLCPGIAVNRRGNRRHPEPEVARLSDHHELDVGALVGEAISLAEPIAPLCESDCPGLCIECGERLGPGHAAHETDDVDPRLAALRGFRVDADGESE